MISKNINNNKIDFIEDLNKIDFPAWEDFPLKNYWDLGYSLALYQVINICLYCLQEDVHPDFCVVQKLTKENGSKKCR